MQIFLGYFKQGIHELTGMQQLAEQVVRYDLDDVDCNWLSIVNEEREDMGSFAIHEWTMERILEEFETQCHENMQQIIKTSDGTGIEYDENILCDVCQSPDSEENNEMVFCDACDICVHQACYGIQTIPEGSWLCRTCALGIQPTCILCPNSGGAMKSTRSGTKWAHVSCSLWIPEVSIGCVEKMEPITKISHIPASRWALVCCICRDRVGACIQCSVKTCKTAFHVTCAFQNKLEMKTILEPNEDDVKLKAYCPKHTKKRGGTDSEPGTPIKKQEALTPSPRKEEMTNEEKEDLRQEKIKELEEDFYTCVKVNDVAAKLQVQDDVIELLFQYWKLKRRVNFNKPLLMPKTEEADILLKQQEDSLVARMKMFVHLRQDLERVRNLCYMVSRREKIRRQLYRMKEEIFEKQAEVTDEEALTGRELKALVGKNHGTDIYDKPELVLQIANEEIKENLNNDDNEVRIKKVRGAQARTKEARLRARAALELGDNPSDGTKVNNQQNRPESSDYNNAPNHVLIPEKRTSARLLTRSRVSPVKQESPERGVSAKNDIDPVAISAVKPIGGFRRKLVVGKPSRSFNSSKHTRNKYRMKSRFSKYHRTLKNKPKVTPVNGKYKSQTYIGQYFQPNTSDSSRKLQIQSIANRLATPACKKEALECDNVTLRCSPELPVISTNKKQISSVNGLEHSSPETRQVKRRLDADLESNCSEKVFESVDDEVSICRSSRDNTPEKELPARRRSIKRDLDFYTYPDYKRNRRSRTPSDCNRSDNGSNQSELSIIDADFSTTQPMSRRRSLRSVDSSDDIHHNNKKLVASSSRLWSVS